MKNNLQETLSKLAQEIDSESDGDQHTDYLSIASNDKEIAFDSRQAIEAAKTVESQLPVALFMSRGLMWSLLPQLPQVDLALRIEMNPKQVEKEQEWKEIILQAQSTKDVKDAAEKIELLSHLEGEMLSLGEQHYLYSDENLKRAQQKIRSSTIIYLQSDIMNNRLIETLASSFEQTNADIIFADMTNVMDWISRLSGKNKNEVLAVLRQLPFHQDAALLYSYTGRGQKMGRGAKPRRVGQTQGVENYLNATWQVQNRD